MRSKSCKTVSLSMTIVALAGGLMTSGCADSIGSAIPQVQAGPNASILHAESLVSDSKTEEIPIQKSDSSNPSWVGTHKLELSNGTPGTITIAQDGTATLSVQNSTTAYQVKPIQEPFPQDDSTYQFSAQGLIANDCMSRDRTCESMLQEVSHQASELAPSENFASTDDRFIYQTLSSEFFQQVLQINRDCEVITAAPCSTRTYTFQDGTLTTKSDGKASSEYTMTFPRAVTQSVALSYLAILNRGNEVNPETSELHPNKIAVQSCSDASVICEAEFVTNSTGEIAGVRLIQLNPEQNLNPGRNVATESSTPPL